MTNEVGRQKIKSYCSLCIARCGCIATVEGGRFVALDPDPSHPTGQALSRRGNALPPWNIGALHYASAMPREPRWSGLNSSRAELRMSPRLTPHSQRYAVTGAVSNPTHCLDGVESEIEDDLL